MPFWTQEIHLWELKSLFVLCYWQNIMAQNNRPQRVGCQRHQVGHILYFWRKLEMASFTLGRIAPLLLKAPVYYKEWTVFWDKCAATVISLPQPGLSTMFSKINPMKDIEDCYQLNNQVYFKSTLVTEAVFVTNWGVILVPCSSSLNGKRTSINVLNCKFNISKSHLKNKQYLFSLAAITYSD